MKSAYQLRKERLVYQAYAELFDRIAQRQIAKNFTNNAKDFSVILPEEFAEIVMKLPSDKVNQMTIYGHKLKLY